MTSKKTFKEAENEKTRGKKRFLERTVEEQEAEDEIKNYIPEDEEFPEPDGY